LGRCYSVDQPAVPAARSVEPLVGATKRLTVVRLGAL